MACWASLRSARFAASIAGDGTTASEGQAQRTAEIGSRAITCRANGQSELPGATVTEIAVFSGTLFNVADTVVRVADYTATYLHSVVDE